MQRLKAEEFSLLSSKEIKQLVQNRILTILDFLQEDTEKLSAITKLTLPQVVAVRNDIIKKYSAPLVSGTTLLFKGLLKTSYLSTGIHSLDTILGGGIPTGSITEICGVADAGKTQLCFQLAINCVTNTGNCVLYIDTKGDFSATRIQKILDTRGFSHKEMALTMFKIKIVNVWTINELIELFKTLKSIPDMVGKLCMIIIDSLPCLMFQHLGDNNKVGLVYLNTLVNYSRYLCKELDIGLVFVNIQTRWVDQEAADLGDDGETSTTTSLFKETYVEKRNRCLGNYWQCIPALILLLDKIPDDPVTKDFSALITATIIKTNNLKCNGNCVLKISSVGVT